MGSDFIYLRRTAEEQKFQSTLPGWGATTSSADLTSGEQFQSTLPGWGATANSAYTRAYAQISIHAPRMGSDRSRRLPWSLLKNISIHAPRMGSDYPIYDENHRAELFQSTLPGWGATGNADMASHHITYFNPRSPDGERPRKWTSSPTIWAKSSIFNTDCIADRH